METRDTALWVVLGAVGLAAAWGLVRVGELQADLQTLEVRMEDSAARAGKRAERWSGGQGAARVARSGGRAPMGMGVGGMERGEEPKPTLDLDDPAVLEQVESMVEHSQERQWEQRREMMKAHRAEVVGDELNALAEAHDLGDEEVEQLQAVLDDFFSSVDATREAIRAGDLAPSAMRQEVRAAREEAMGLAAEVVGEEAAAELWEAMPQGPGPGMGMGGGR